MQSPTNRLFFIDLLKALSITAVVSYHAIFVPQYTYVASAAILELIFAPLRFCVPILLTISFLLIERQLDHTPSYLETKDVSINESQRQVRGTISTLETKRLNLRHLNFLFAHNQQRKKWVVLQKRLIRLLIPTLFWISVAASLKLLNGNSLVEVSGTVFNGTVFTGSYYFLVVLQLLPIFFLVRHWLNHSQTTLIFILFQSSIFMFIYTALFGTFSNQIVSTLRNLDRPFIIYWLVYIALGVYLHKKFKQLVRVSHSISSTIKILLICVTGLLFVLEYRQLILLSGGSIAPFDYVAFSCILSVPVLFLCFASIKEQKVPLALVVAIKILSKYSLGIFCINGIISQIFLSFGSKFFSHAVFSLPEILIIKIIGWLVLLGISLGLSIILERIGLKKVVC